MWRHRLVFPGIIVFLGFTVALACGPDFPWQLLDHRAATLKETPANSFAFEAEHLEPQPADGLTVLAQARSTDSEETAEFSGLQMAALKEMRGSKSGEDAYAKGAVLPAAARLYLAGAIDFKRGKFAPALNRFQAVLLLPEAQRRARATWSAYMLGRSYAAQGDTEQAVQAFQLTRSLVVQGAPDPLGLALASYGEEARVYLRRAKSCLNGNQVPPAATAQYSSDIARAVALYARQAAHASVSGVWSLRIVANDLLSTDTRVRACVSDPMVQRLLVAYVLANFNDSPAWRSYWTEPEPSQPSSPAPIFISLVDAIQARGLDHPAGADRLAAAAYRIGRYDLARQLADQASGPLAAWIKAKLALQKGDLSTAAAFYAEASRAFPPLHDRAPVLDEANEALLLGEQGVLTLARGEYVEALAQLYPMAETYCGDVAYIAERVLTVDELKRFVDAGFAAATPTPGPQGQSRLTGSPQPDVEPPIENWLVQDPSKSLRNLLARRLVREGRYREAMDYFEEESSPPGSSDHKMVRKQVELYALALHDTAHRWGAVARARAWYQAALLARGSGMEMMGYEGPPDYFATGGAFDWGLGQLKLGHDFVTEDERARFTASVAQPDLRFHYRYVAVAQASRAADLLPPRSQAFAAVLCHATGWMISTRGAEYRSGAEDKARSSELVRQLYHRYLTQGPYVPWATHFGNRCPDPDFDSAAIFYRTQWIKKAHHLGRHYQLLIGMALLLGALGLVIRRTIKDH
ncbi:MAG TPA: hypothetical protein VGH29_18170 [Candidatus Binataceae bacterium]